MRDAPTGELLAKMMRRETLPEMSERQRQALGELHGLWFAKEPSHNRGKHKRDLVHSLMVTELMTPDATGKALTLNQGVSLHPASFNQAQAGGQEITREMKAGTSEPRSDMNEKTRKARAKRLGREMGTLKLWFRRHAKDLPNLERAPTIADVEQFVDGKIREFLAQHQGED
jgi:hypothetical protein